MPFLSFWRQKAKTQRAIPNEFFATFLSSAKERANALEDPVKRCQQLAILQLQKTGLQVDPWLLAEVFDLPRPRPRKVRAWLESKISGLATGEPNLCLQLNQSVAYLWPISLILFAWKILIY
jgi:hypothetical protein